MFARDGTNFIPISRNLIIIEINLFKLVDPSSNQNQRLNKVKNSVRVLELSLNSPSIQLVTVLLVVFWTPLMTMHM